MECSNVNLFRIRKKLNNFCFESRIDDHPCLFRIDTGSDITILREKFLDFKEHRILANNCLLRYPTGETVTVENKAVVKIEIGKFCLDFPVFIAKIEDDCILGVDFLERIKLGEIFTSVFNGKELGNQKSFLCSRISKGSERIPPNLLEFYEKNSTTLDISQRERFAEIIVDFLDIFTDCFTKWVEAFPLSNIRAKTIAEVFMNQVISRFGVPLELHTDQGRNFESKMFQELAQMLGIRKTRTTPFHPQSNGQVERQHRTLLDYLAKFISENQKDWDRWVSLGLLAYRSSKHEATGFTPSELFLEREIKLPLDLL